MITVDVKDEITPLLKRYLENNPRMIASLTKSLGWYVQGSIKKLGRERLAEKWRERVPLEVRRKLDEQAPKGWLGKLRRAIGYSYNSATQSVAIGWTSSSAAMEGKIQEFGASREVTPRLQKYFAARGVPLSEHKKRIKVPKRPIYEPAMDIIYPKLGDYVREKVESYMENGGHVRNTAKSRKYEVFA